MRNWEQYDQYLTTLNGDIYEQPEDGGHTRLAQKIIKKWVSKMTTCKTVLDVGCGSGFCQPMFEELGKVYEGVSLGEEAINAQARGRNVKNMDFNFLEYNEKSFDLIFSRHSAEHSPMPVMTLMEWARVAKSWLIMVVPTPDWYGYGGQNHYSVLNNEQWLFLLDRAGWNVLWQHVDELIFDENSGQKKPHEYWFMAEKKRLR